MKFKAKYVVDETPPGTTRLVRVFALLPKRIGDDWVWLECYEVLQAWLVTSIPLQIKGKPTIFTLSKWTDVSTRIIP